MQERLTQQQKKEIRKLYDEGMRLPEIARQMEIGYQRVYAQTRLNEKVRQKTNPETGKPFESNTAYLEYRARQRTNPETGKPFESLTELQGYQVRQRTNPETGKPFESNTAYLEY
ncbi:MAG: hypothetical protein AABX95_01320, partial [Nanoarchaeota archaeon]